MKKLLFILLFAAQICMAQTYQNRELFPKTLQGTTSRIIVIHNHSNIALVLSFQSGAATGTIEPGQTQEVLLPNTWSGYIGGRFGYSTSMTDALGTDVDTAKPYIKHIHVYDLTSGPGTIFVHVPAVNIPDDYEQFHMGMTLGFYMVAFLAVLWTIKKKFKIVVP